MYEYLSQEERKDLAEAARLYLKEGLSETTKVRIVYSACEDSKAKGLMWPADDGPGVDTLAAFAHIDRIQLKAAHLAKPRLIGDKKVTIWHEGAAGLVDLLIPISVVQANGAELVHRNGFKRMTFDSLGVTHMVVPPAQCILFSLGCVTVTIGPKIKAKVARVTDGTVDVFSSVRVTDMSITLSDNMMLYSPEQRNGAMF